MNNITIAQTKTETPPTQSNPIVNIRNVDKWRCHRGLVIYQEMNNDMYEFYCLCPSSYYGDRCQYQNQRVSLSLQIRITLDWRTLFTFIIILIDDNGNRESHDHIEYLASRDCNVKFNIYLLYSTRLKNVSKNYSVRIDAFSKLTLTYRASWIFPLPFPFFPVHRLSVLLRVPISPVQPFQKCTPPYIHGQCFNYVNDRSSTFCRCEPNWSGIQGSIKYKCACAPNSLCIDESICLCPLNRFGPRCYLVQSSCNPQSCTNGGQCVPRDERYIEYLPKRTCVCPQEYYGDCCEYPQSRIDISFHDELIIPQSLLIHFITVKEKAAPIRSSTIKKIPLDQDSLSLYTSITFNIAFAEMSRNYYLIILRKQAIVSATISTQIIPSHRCALIDELFNKTLANQRLLKCVKYYHIPCKERLELVCFYDDVHFCLCDLARQANCFEFNHNMTYDCYGQNFCENGGQCFQDDPKCPTSAVCVCRDCYYGSRCQFSTKSWTLSLDTILSYQIHPHIQISRQPIIVKISIAVTTIMFGCGFISSLFSFLTFRSPATRNVGCGLYLLTSSIVSMITMSVFTMKFWFLLASQKGSINNRSFVQAQCMSIDFLLRLFLSTGDWLSVCVAIERAVNVARGVNFNKEQQWATNRSVRQMLI
ncbi:unnamed protein product [Rotaria sp. Silwood1]|nr:unnamed protein product [Rotaria sp. Silwood1]